ncbi:MAG TPA: TetR/AcrR family transcriptional regulator C-terminal domain-containing protein [Micromonosporaceae bacterium]|nr:TetR/AcrR family transcriptional regulator C-terminal domain-containing protein [Micromonosporaceae bacterium]
MAEPPYLRIVADIRRRITAGQLRPGDRVPSTRQLAQEWGVALATATKALTALAQEGLVEAVPRAGTVVAAPPARSPRRAVADVELSRERIVRAAIEVADAEGLSAVSMRRVAAELGVATMSLYRHVPGKDELVMLMADVAYGEAPPPEPAPDGWRARLEGLARLQWALFRRHPWLARVISLTRPMPVLNGMAHTEYTMRAIDGLGLDRATMMRVAITLAGHLQAIAMNLESEVEAEQDTGMTSDEWMAATYPDDGGVMASGRFPLLASLAQEPDADLGLDDLFEGGLTLLLDGIAALVARAAPPGG